MTEAQAQAPESLEYRTEVKQLLDILAHSLYTDREIFLRELISNASDALNRVQFEMLTNHDVVDPDAKLAITITYDSEAGVITISDTGIGMNHDELIEKVWGYQVVGDEPGFVQTQVSRLRRELDRAGLPDLVRTARGVGYGLCGQFTRSLLGASGSSLGTSPSTATYPATRPVLSSTAT